MTEPIPMTVFSGYLGAGKTTLIGRLIDRIHSERLCVIVNDFGELSIDAEVLRRADGMTLPLPNGCVCCSAATGLYKAFDTVLRLDPRPSRILLEASGVADPSRLRAIAEAEPELEPGRIVTVVDAAGFAANIEDALKRPDMVRQIEAAELLLLSKTDLLPAAEAEDVHGNLSLMAPAARVMPMGEDDSVLFDLAAGSMAPLGLHAGDGARAHFPEHRYGSCTVRCGEIRDLDRFIHELVAAALPLVRLKGFLRIAGRRSPILLDLVDGRAGVKTIHAGTSEGTTISAIYPREMDLVPALEYLLARHGAI